MNNIINDAITLISNLIIHEKLSALVAVFDIILSIVLSVAVRGVMATLAVSFLTTMLLSLVFTTAFLALVLTTVLLVLVLVTGLTLLVLTTTLFLLVAMIVTASLSLSTILTETILFMAGEITTRTIKVRSLCRCLR